MLTEPAGITRHNEPQSNPVTDDLQAELRGAAGAYFASRQSTQRRGLFSKVKGLFHRNKGRESQQPNVQAEPPAAVSPGETVEGKRVESRPWRESLSGRVRSARENATSRLESFKKGLEDFTKSPFGNAALKTTLELIEDKLKGKSLGKLAISFAAAKFASRYLFYQGKETAAKVIKSSWEHRGDIITGAVAGAALRTILITAGWEAYLGKAAASGIVAAGRKAWVELESYDKPETLKARLNLINRVRALTPEQRANLRNKTLIAGAFGFGGSILGMEFMEHTGLGNWLHEAAAQGLEKVGSVVGQIGQGVGDFPRPEIPQLPNVELPHPNMPDVPHFDLPQVELPHPQIPNIEVPNPLAGVGESVHNLGDRAGEIAEQAGQKIGEFTAGLSHPDIPRPNLSEFPRPELPQMPLPELPPIPHPDMPQPLSGLGEKVGEGVQALGHLKDQLLNQSYPTEVSGGDSVQPPPAEPPPVTETPPPIEASPEPPSISESVPPQPEVGSPAPPVADQPVPTIPGAEQQPSGGGEQLATTEGSVAHSIDEAINNLPSEATIQPSSGQTPWAIAEQLLKQANPNHQFTPGDIMEVDKVLCEQNQIAVPEWGIVGDETWKSARALASEGKPVSINIDDRVRDIVKIVASK